MRRDALSPPERLWPGNDRAATQQILQACLCRDAGHSTSSGPMVRGGGVWPSISGMVLPKGGPLMLGEEVTWPNLYYSFK